MTNPATHGTRHKWGRRLLALAAVAYASSLPLTANTFTPAVGWQTYRALAEDAARSAREGDWLMAAAGTGMLYANAVAAAAAVTLLLGHVRVARASGLLTLGAFWSALAAVVVYFAFFAGGTVFHFFVEQRGSYLWAISLHFVAAAAFVWPLPPRKSDGPGHN